MTGEQALLRVESADFGYSRAAPAVVAGVSLALHRGDFVVVRGPNGCGKSTIVKGILGLTPTLSGNVGWESGTVRVGYVPQETGVSGDLPFTALDLVKCAFSVGWGRSTRRASEALERVDLTDQIHARFGTLSGGQKRRVLLARALAIDPDILLLDEPTANVDGHTEQVIAAIIEGMIATKQAAVLAVAHAQDFGPGARVVRIQEGRAYV